MTLTEAELAVIVPVYNEEEIIGKVLDAWSGELNILEIDYKIHVYNDGSKDNTLAILNEYSNENKSVVIHNKANSGHGPTVLRGYRENSEVTWILQIDSDDEIGTEFFEEFWEQRKDFDFLIGRRVDRRSPLGRRFISFAARTLVRVFYGRGVYDVNCPYRLMRSHMFRETFSEIPIDTFAPNVIITAIACRNDYRILEIPVIHSQRATGVVSIRRWTLLKAAARSLWQTILYRFQMQKHT